MRLRSPRNLLTLCTAVLITACVQVEVGWGQSKAESRAIERAQKIIKTNLGPEINTSYSELAPIISPDGLYLYFTMGSGHPGNLGEDRLQDCYVAKRLGDGHWSTPRNLGTPINTSGNDAVSGVSPDGSVLFIKNFAHNHLSGLCFARNVGRGRWEIDSITIDKYSNDSPLATQCISSNGREIIFSAERNDGQGGADLYVSHLLTTGSNHYSEPVNLGASINTASDEFAPFLAADGRTLYFSSRGHGGFGDADVFVAKRQDDSWTNWSTPRNLGPEINTSGMDAYYSIPASGDVAYFSSSNGANHMDLYMVTLSEELRPNPMLLVSGKVMGPAGQPLVSTVVSRDPMTDSIIASAETNPYSGSYAIILPRDRPFFLTAEAPGFLPYAGSYDLTRDANVHEYSVRITLDTAVAMNGVTLASVYFGADSSLLRPESHYELDRLAKLMLENPGWSVSIEGFTDSSGSSDRNMQLSRERAKAVVGYLRAKGIDPDRLLAVGLGPEGPIASNTTAEGRRQNRRVVFRIREVH